MYKHKYSLGGYIFEIDSLYEYFYLYSREYISNNNPNYVIVNTEEELDQWISSHNEQGPRDYLETLLIQSKVADILVKYDVYIFHGSSIYIDNVNNGFIFTGPSGVGKSTHVSKLKEYYQDRLAIINDDKPFLDKDFYIYGSPWSGKSHISINSTAKLKAIFIIYQSKDNKINELKPSEAINYLIKQIHLPKGKEETNNGLDYLIRLVKDVPIYHLGLNLESDSINNTINAIKRYL